MLYDNALLIDTYTRAWQRYPKPLYQRVVEETIQWLEREMRSPHGAFHAALDADTEGEEGRTYLWTPAEIEAVLGATEGCRFAEAYGITEEGNFEHSGRSNPALLDGDPDVREALAPARLKLLTARDQRPQPGRDDKCLTAWNALLLRGLARAAFTFGRTGWLDQARAIGDWIWENMRQEGDRLHSVAYGETGGGNGMLDDYAHAAEGFLALAAVVDWARPGESARWIGRARRLAEVVRRHFADPDGVGCFFTSDDHEALVHRSKEWFDNATPAGNSALVHVFTALEALTGEAEYGAEAARLQTAYPGLARAAPAAAGHALAGFTWRAIGLAVIKAQPDADLEGLRTALVARPWRPVFILATAAPSQNAAYQLCVGTECLAPTDSLEELAENL
jgi:uncharacterized protein YyaL (SSP411 family)